MATGRVGNESATPISHPSSIFITLPHPHTRLKWDGLGHVLCLSYSPFIIIFMSLISKIITFLFNLLIITHVCLEMMITPFLCMKSLNLK